MTTSNNLNEDILNLFKKQVHVLHSFKHIYLFGSVLKNDSNPNDMDILLLYTVYSEKMVENAKLLSDVLEKACGLPIHLTMLSVEEEKNTAFLKKLGHNYLKIQ